MLGMNMKVEKVSLDRVKQKLLNLKRKEPEKSEVTEEDLEKRLEELEKQAEEERLRKKNKNKIDMG
jgi:U4/U6.U5 tri-snRNP component SNU23